MGTAVAISSKSNNDSNSKKRSRGTGKLSSRNTRRKRRDHGEHPENKSKAPIPSFSFNIDEEEDDNLASAESPDSKPSKVAADNTAEEVKQRETNKSASSSHHESINVDEETGGASGVSIASCAFGLDSSTIGDNSNDCGEASALRQIVMEDVTKSKETEIFFQKPEHPSIMNDVGCRAKLLPKVYDMLEDVDSEKKSSITTTIEILDNDEQVEKIPPLVSRAISANFNREEKVSQKPRPETDPISVESSDEEGVIAPKKTKATEKKKPARRKPVTFKSKLDSKDAAGESSCGTQKLSRKKRCSACTSCTCQSKDGSSASPQQLSFLTLSGTSDARVEQTLKNRMLKIERNIAWAEGQWHDCARELKRHRSALQRKFLTTGANADKRRHFLAEANVSDELAQSFATARVDREEVKRIRTRVFGKRSSLSKKAPQPTLTQMFGGDEGCRGIDQSCSDDTTSSAEESSHADPHDSLSFWKIDSSHTDPFLGSMTQFEEATILFKGKLLHSTAAWARATAKDIRKEEIFQSREEEEGIDALVELFNLSPKKKSEPIISLDECNGSVLKSQLSQSGAKAVRDITEEIVRDEAKRAAIESACPNWKENVEYSFRRKDSDGLENALNQVKKERQKLEDVRDRILQAFLERSSTLEVYEKAIEGSLNRLAEKENERQADEVEEEEGEDE